MPCIVPIVEGPGDIKAVPELLRKILYHREWWHWRVAPPKKAGNLDALRKRLGRFIRYAHKEKDCGAILILLDLDDRDDCPKEEAYKLAEEVRQLHINCPVAVVFARREYEAWFLASLKTVGDACGLFQNVIYEKDIENKRDVKGWLSNQMPGSQTYKELIHQVKFTEFIDIDLAREHSRSFQRLYHAVEELVSLAGKPRVTPMP